MTFYDLLFLNTRLLLWKANLAMDAVLIMDSWGLIRSIRWKKSGEFNNISWGKRAWGPTGLQHLQRVKSSKLLSSKPWNSRRSDKCQVCQLQSLCKMVNDEMNKDVNINILKEVHFTLSQFTSKYMFSTIWIITQTLCCYGCSCYWHSSNQSFSTSGLMPKVPSNGP